MCEIIHNIDEQFAEKVHSGCNRKVSEHTLANSLLTSQSAHTDQHNIKQWKKVSWFELFFLIHEMGVCAGFLGKRYQDAIGKKGKPAVTV